MIIFVVAADRMQLWEMN